MTALPRVSVIMIFLNAEPFIEEAIRSVSSQSFKQWELLLVDDGSTDASGAIARRFAAEDPGRIRYLTHEDRKNHGMSASRNLGVREARGEFISLLDADDVYLPQKLDVLVKVLDSNPAAAMVYGATKYWHSWHPAGKRRDWIWRSFGVPVDTPIEAPRLLVSYLSDGRTVPCTCGLLVRRSVVEQVGAFEDDFRGLYEDQVFFAKVASSHQIIVLGECLDQYRQHPESTCTSADPETLHTARGKYLDWLNGYLSDIGSPSTEVAVALAAARAATILEEGSARAAMRNRTVAGLLRRVAKQVRGAVSGARLK